MVAATEAENIPDMSARPTTKLVSCPECSASFERAIVWFDGREIMADRGCLCDECESKRAAAIAALTAREKHLELWLHRTPDDYHRAAVERVCPSLRPALEWRPVDGCCRLGLWGVPGGGKSMAAALVVKDAGIPFRWTNGFAARATYNAAVTGEGESRRKAAASWLNLLEAPLLVLDDADKGNFTEAWASALFDLMEARNGACLPTIWTSNNGPGGLAKKMGKCGDPDLAASIERRLCGGAKLYCVTGKL